MSNRKSEGYQTESDEDDCDVDKISKGSTITDTSVIQMENSFDDASSQNSGAFDYLNQKAMQDKLRRHSHLNKGSDKGSSFGGRNANSSIKGTQSEAMSQGGVVRVNSVTSEDTLSVEMAGLSGVENDSQSGRGQQVIDDYSDESPERE